MAAAAARENRLRHGASVDQDLIGIATSFNVGSAGPMAALATTVGRILVFQSLNMS